MSPLDGRIVDYVGPKMGLAFWLLLGMAAALLVAHVAAMALGCVED